MCWLNGVICQFIRTMKHNFHQKQFLSKIFRICLLLMRLLTNFSSTRSVHTQNGYFFNFYLSLLIWYQTRRKSGKQYIQISWASVKKSLSLNNFNFFNTNQHKTENFCFSEEKINFTLTKSKRNGDLFPLVTLFTTEKYQQYEGENTSEIGIGCFRLNILYFGYFFPKIRWVFFLSLVNWRKFDINELSMNMNCQERYSNLNWIHNSVLLLRVVCIWFFSNTKLLVAVYMHSRNKYTHRSETASCIRLPKIETTATVAICVKTHLNNVTVKDHYK